MKRNRKLLALTLSALMTAGLLAGCSAASSSTTETDVATSAAGTTAETANPGGEDGVFTIAYAPNESNTEAADARNGLAEDLGAVLGCKVEGDPGQRLQRHHRSPAHRQRRHGLHGLQALALGVERTGLEPIVMKAEDGDPEKAIYHSVFITNAANTDINSIEDIKAGPWPSLTGLHLRQPGSHRRNHQAFPDDNLNSDMLHTNGDFFEAVSFSGSHQAACRRW